MVKSNLVDTGHFLPSYHFVKFYTYSITIRIKYRVWSTYALRLENDEVLAKRNI